MVDFAFFSASGGLSRTWAIDGFSVFAAIVDFAAFTELVLDDAGFGSLGSLAAIPLKQPNPFGSVHASMLTCGGKIQLQPTRVAARKPTKSVLMQIPHQKGA
ncbi:hypothetical protein ACH79_23945 [Bradyrhizobium sp. CCBAU 051011]|nr:hypothetical protein ACH79_23945 [Bradyrhizobium sp. CCBAU 051011]